MNALIVTFAVVVVVGLVLFGIVSAELQPIIDAFGAN